MTEPIDFAQHSRDRATEVQGEEPQPLKPVGVPSNEVYARVGDTVLQAAQEGVRRGQRPEEIIRGIVTQHGVRLNLAEFRLLLASRRISQ